MYRSDITKSAYSYPCFVCTVSLQEMIESLPDCDSQHIWTQKSVVNTMKKDINPERNYDWIILANEHM